MFPWSLYSFSFYPLFPNNKTTCSIIRFKLKFAWSQKLLCHSLDPQDCMPLFPTFVCLFHLLFIADDFLIIIIESRLVFPWSQTSSQVLPCSLKIIWQSTLFPRKNAPPEPWILQISLKDISSPFFHLQCCHSCEFSLQDREQEAKSINLLILIHKTKILWTNSTSQNLLEQLSFISSFNVAALKCGIQHWGGRGVGQQWNREWGEIWSCELIILHHCCVFQPNFMALLQHVSLIALWCLNMSFEGHCSM